MKKFITMITALVCVAAMAISASAAEFVPSVVQSNKAPEVVSATDKDGNTVDIKTVGMADATGDTKTALDAAYKDLTEKKVTDLVSADDLQKAAGNTKIDDLVVKDLFDASEYENGTVVNEDGKVTFTVKTDIKAGSVVVVLHDKNGNWEVIPAENVKLNADGTLTITCENGLSPFAILVNSAAAGTGAAKTDAKPTDGKVSPKTGETVSVAAVAACATFVVLAGAAVVMGKKKSA